MQTVSLDQWNQQKTGPSRHTMQTVTLSRSVEPSKRQVHHDTLYKQSHSLDQWNQQKDRSITTHYANSHTLSISGTSKKTGPSRHTMQTVTLSRSVEPAKRQVHHDTLCKQSHSLDQWNQQKHRSITTHYANSHALSISGTSKNTGPSRHTMQTVTLSRSVEPAKTQVHHDTLCKQSRSLDQWNQQKHRSITTHYANSHALSISGTSKNTGPSRHTMQTVTLSRSVEPAKTQVNSGARVHSATEACDPWPLLRKGSLYTAICPSTFFSSRTNPLRQILQFCSCT